MIRQLLPASFKRWIRIQQRKRNDRAQGVDKLFARSKKPPSSEFQEQISIHQPIFYNPLSANKVDNIEIAISLIHPIRIEAGQVFSFWEIIGEPTAKSGFKIGRNIIGDKLQEDIGGGLCQVAGMIYHLALISGMEILERHGHSLDLYEENKRYTPLGADASVVFGYKDIRFKNKTEAAVYLSFEVDQENFTGKVVSSSTIEEHSIEFQRQEYEGYRTIHTYRYKGEQQKVLINESNYLLPPNQGS